MHALYEGQQCKRQRKIPQGGGVERKKKQRILSLVLCVFVPFFCFPSSFGFLLVEYVLATKKKKDVQGEVASSSSSRRENVLLSCKFSFVIGFLGVCVV
jgi:hypothetical protein